MRRHCVFICCVLVFFWSAARVGKCAPPTCYSRAIQLSKVIMNTLEKVYRHPNTKDCAESFPKLFLDIHNACVTHKLQDFVYVLENLTEESCKERLLIKFLRRRTYVLYQIVSRMCYRDLVFLSNDCVALDTGIIQPQYVEDTLQLLIETD